MKDALVLSAMTLTLGLPATILAVAVAYTLANWPEETWQDRVRAEKVKPKKKAIS